MVIFGKNIPGELISSICIVLISLILYIVIKFVINGIIKSSNKSKKSNRRKKTILQFITRIIKYVIILVTIINILNIYHVNTTALVTSIGVASLIVGFALQDILKDILVGITVILEDSFSIGDIIKVKNYKGEVIDFNLKTTKIKAITGEVFVISNRYVDEVINYSINKNVILVDINTRYEDNVKDIREVLDKICNSLSKDKELFEYVKLEDGIEKLDDSSVVYRISALVDIKDIYVAKRKILEEVKVTFDKNNISIPYTQIEVHNE